MASSWPRSYIHTVMTVWSPWLFGICWSRDTGRGWRTRESNISIYVRAKMGVSVSQAYSISEHPKCISPFLLGMRYTRLFLLKTIPLHLKFITQELILIFTLSSLNNNPSSSVLPPAYGLNFLREMYQYTSSEFDYSNGFSSEFLLEQWVASFSYYCFFSFVHEFPLLL